MDTTADRSLRPLVSVQNLNPSYDLSYEWLSNMSAHIQWQGKHYIPRHSLLSGSLEFFWKLFIVSLTSIRFSFVSLCWVPAAAQVQLNARNTKANKIRPLPPTSHWTYFACYYHQNKSPVFPSWQTFRYLRLPSSGHKIHTHPPKKSRYGCAMEREANLKLSRFSSVSTI